MILSDEATFPQVFDASTNGESSNIFQGICGWLKLPIIMHSPDHMFFVLPCWVSIHSLKILYLFFYGLSPVASISSIFYKIKITNNKSNKVRFWKESWKAKTKRFYYISGKIQQQYV